MARTTRQEPIISWEEHRRRMLRETERFIEWGLAHPEYVIEIPAKPITEHYQPFPKRVADWFWIVTLSDRLDSQVQKWRNILLHRPTQFLRRRAKLR